MPFGVVDAGSPLQQTPENSETSLCLAGFDWLLIYRRGNET